MKNKIALVQFDVTSKCNFKCRHCYAGDIVNTDLELTYEEIKTIIDNLDVPGVETIAFYGGEPLIRDDIEDILKICSNKGINTYITTNGYYINSKIESLLKCGLKGMAVSIDGASEETYKKIRGKDCLKLIKDNFKLLSSLGLEDRVINFVLMKENMHEATDIIDFALEVGATRINYEMLAYGGSASKYNICKELTPEEFIQTIENICMHVYNKNLAKDLVNIDIAPPKVIEYVNNKLNTNFPLVKKRQHIPLELMYIDFKGNAFPCKGTHPDFNYKNSNFKINGYSLLTGTALDALKSKEFINVFSDLGPNILSEKLVYCKQCKYFVKYCYPCPISLLNSCEDIAHSCTEYPISNICKVIDKSV